MFNSRTERQADKQAGDEQIGRKNLQNLEVTLTQVA